MIIKSKTMITRTIKNTKIYVNPKWEKTTDGDERRIHYKMEEHKTDLRTMCFRKRSESDYKSLRMLFHKIGIA